VLAVLLAAGAGTSAARQSAPPDLGFLIDLSYSGGYVPTLAQEGVTIGADGRIGALGTGGPKPDAAACRVPLTEAERQAVRDALAAATRRPWPATFDPAGDDGCCDRRKWILRLRPHDDVKRTAFVTTWFDGNEKHLPRELLAIKDIVATARKRLAGCPR
jgi:hypothetical protein